MASDNLTDRLFLKKIRIKKIIFSMSHKVKSLCDFLWKKAEKIYKKSENIHKIPLTIEVYNIIIIATRWGKVSSKCC